jgi:anaerobic ribonucleoside-triphosphate reductase
MLWEMSGKFGYPYFANFLNSDMKPSDIRSMCCRLSLNLKELVKRNGGLFGSGDSTGSIGVVTINLPRIAYLSRGKKESFYKDLTNTLNLAKDSLEIKRQWLNENILEKRLIPAYSTYVGTLKNHFSTVGVIGLNEMCENFFGQNILSEEGKTFSLEVLEFIREKLIQFQEETGNLFNLEATPAESTCYRLAKKDKEEFDDIITRGTDEAPYYTNSCHIPVSQIQGIKQVFDHQNDLQIMFTGGTVIHIYCDGAINKDQAKHIIHTVCNEYKVPYISISPLNRYCQNHGYIADKVEVCPKCGEELDLYQRITGYLRKVKFFNVGKKSEFKERNQLHL